MKVGHCIQAGIYTTSEYLYLTEDDWKQKVEGQSTIGRSPHPKVVNSIDRWKYYGIDHNLQMLTEHIDRVIDQVGTNKGHWLSATLSGFSQDKYLKSNYNYNMFAPNQSLDDVVNGFGLEDVALLVLDIENDEYMVLKNYSWSICPLEIAVEVHSFIDYAFIEKYNHRLAVYKPENMSGNPQETLRLNQNAMKNMIESKGYTLYFNRGLNDFVEEHPTSEMKFIRQDLLHD